MKFTHLRHVAGWMLSIGLTILGSGMVSGQTYPNKLVRIVTAEAGGGGDFAARLIAQGITASLGQQVIVENRAGFMSIETVAKSSPDGYNLLLYGSSLWIVPLLRSDLPWDPVRDFSPITLVASSPNTLVVHPSVPANSVKELISLAKARTGELNYASGAMGSANHLAAELFKAMAGVDIVQINYKGTGPALNGLISGQVQVLFINAVSVAPHVKSGRARALAVTSAQPSPLAPGLPTVAASGLPGYDSTSKWGIFAPAGTSATIVNRLNQEIVQVLNKAEVRERLFNSGVETVGSSPEELTATMKSEMTRLGKVIRDASIRAE